MSGKFAGKVALVTGAGGGIGLEIVGRLAGQGCALVLADINDDVLAPASKRAADAGVQSWQLAGDLFDGDYCDSLPAKAREAAGGLDILINNAGLMRRGDILESTMQDFQESFAINVEAPFRLCRTAIGLMKQHGGGSIVNVSSCWGVYPGPAHVVYCTTKAAVASLTRCLGRDHAGDGIRVNAVCPNEVDTPMLRAGFAKRGLDPEHGIEQLNQTVPIGRVADAHEIARVVEFLASDDAAYMCGSLVEINGGKPVY
jgi:2-keto-3-deoxy-L-fuconate dehydrogenase